MTAILDALAYAAGLIFGPFWPSGLPAAERIPARYYEVCPRCQVGRNPQVLVRCWNCEAA